MTADVTEEVGLAELLHLPQVQVRAEQVGPGRQGGPLLVVIGTSLIGLALWGWAGDALGWSAFALTALGAASTMTGLGLAGARRQSLPQSLRRPARKRSPWQPVAMVHHGRLADPRCRSSGRRGP